VLCAAYPAVEQHFNSRHQAFYAGPFTIHTAIPADDHFNYQKYYKEIVSRKKGQHDEIPLLLAERSTHAEVVLRIDRDGKNVLNKVRRPQACLWVGAFQLAVQPMLCIE